MFLLDHPLLMCLKVVVVFLETQEHACGENVSLPNTVVNIRLAKVYDFA
jgi:hypothetical protein